MGNCAMPVVKRSSVSMAPFSIGASQSSTSLGSRGSLSKIFPMDPHLMTSAHPVVSGLPRFFRIIPFSKVAVPMLPLTRRSLWIVMEISVESDIKTHSFSTFLVRTVIRTGPDSQVPTSSGGRVQSPQEDKRRKLRTNRHALNRGRCSGLGFIINAFLVLSER